MLSPSDPVLSSTEWAAVSIALQDAQRCGCISGAEASRRSGLHGLGRLVFGSRRPNALADPRLEAIRRFVCDTRRHQRPAAELAAPLADHGFTPAQIDALGLLSR